MDAHGDRKLARVVQAAFKNLGLPVQPAETGAIRRIHLQRKRLPTGGDTILDRRHQNVDALARHSGNQNRPLLGRPPGHDILEPLTAFWIEQVGLVPHFHKSPPVFRIDTEIFRI
jgi:hypothetical protein